MFQIETAKDKDGNLQTNKYFTQFLFLSAPATSKKTPKKTKKPIESKREFFFNDGYIIQLNIFKIIESYGNNLITK